MQSLETYLHGTSSSAGILPLNASSKPSLLCVCVSVPLVLIVMGTKVSKFPRQSEYLLKPIILKGYSIRDKSIDIFVFNNS